MATKTFQLMIEIWSVQYLDEMFDPWWWSFLYKARLPRWSKSKLPVPFRVSCWGMSSVGLGPSITFHVDQGTTEIKGADPPTDICSVCFHYDHCEGCNRYLSKFLCWFARGWGCWVVWFYRNPQLLVCDVHKHATTTSGLRESRRGCLKHPERIWLLLDLDTCLW